MVDKIVKLLRKMEAKEREKILSIRESILDRDFKKLNVSKVKGRKYHFRVRVGNFRIIFFDNGNEISILEIRKRDENTYKNF